MPKFVIITDTHIDDPARDHDIVWWNNVLLPKAPFEIADAWVEQVKRSSPDFVLHCGDVTNIGTPASAECARRILDRVGCPYFIALGNHDAQGYPEARHAMCKALGIPGAGASYAVSHQGIRIVVLHFSMAPDPEEFEKELAWLETELQTHTEMPAIFVTHAPLSLDLREETGTVPGSPSSGGSIAEHMLIYLWKGKEQILSLLSRRKNLIGIFTGHSHTSEVTHPMGMLHCITPSLIEFPFALRECVIDGHCLTVRTVSLPRLSPANP